MDIFRNFEWTFTPQTRELQGRDLHTTRFRLSPTFYFSTSDFFFFGFLSVSEILRTSFWSGFGGLPPPPLPPLLRKKNIEIWGRSLGSFLAKNHRNRSYPDPLLATFRIAEGGSRGGSGGGPGGGVWILFSKFVSLFLLCCCSFVFDFGLFVFICACFVFRRFFIL